MYLFIVLFFGLFFFWGGGTFDFQNKKLEKDPFFKFAKNKVWYREVKRFYFLSF